MAYPGKAETDILYIGFVLGHGGDAIQIGELAAGMAARGNQVRIVVPELETTLEFAERYLGRGVLVERSPWLRADAAGAKQRLGDLLRLFRTFRAPVLHLHTGDVCLPRAALLAMELLRLPRAYATLHSPYETVQAGSLRARFWAQAVSRRFHAIVCPSRHGCETQKRLGVKAQRVRHIPNGVDVARFSSGDGWKPRRELGISLETPLIVFTSRLEEQKRPLDALTAFDEISPEFPEAHLAFIGQGSLLESVRQAALSKGLTDRVHLLGTRHDIPDWLAAATIWTLPTEAENFSLAVLEALAAGCPIVSTLCRGNDEVLVEGENALIHEIGGTGQAEAFRRLLSDSALRERLSRAAQHTAQKYDLPHMVEAHAELYR